MGGVSESVPIFDSMVLSTNERYELRVPLSKSSSAKYLGFFIARMLRIVKIPPTSTRIGGTIQAVRLAPDLGGAAPPVISNTRPSSPQVMNRPLPIDQAQAFTPNITPLNAPGQGWANKPPSIENAVTPKQRPSFSTRPFTM